VGKDLASIEFLPVKCFKPSSQLEDLITAIQNQVRPNTPSWVYRSTAQGPYFGMPSAALRQLHSLRCPPSPLYIWIQHFNLSRRRLVMWRRASVRSSGSSWSCSTCSALAPTGTLR
jgi:hypothetical protein